MNIKFLTTLFVCFFSANSAFAFCIVQHKGRNPIVLKVKSKEECICKIPDLNVIPLNVETKVLVKLMTCSDSNKRCKVKYKERLSFSEIKTRESDYNHQGYCD